MESKQEQKSLPPKEDSAESLSMNSDPISYLESLGFTITDGQARFKLEEAAENDCNVASSNYCDVDEEDALSFVVLGKHSLDFIQQSSLASYVDIQQKSMSTDYDSMIASWDSTVVHQKLNELLQENTKLKETLKQNNIAMKQQFNTLVTWQEEIMKVYQNHKKKFAETREFINYLKKENTQLKMRLSSNLPSYSRMEHEILDACREESMKESEIFNLKEGFNQLTLWKPEELLDEHIKENARKETIPLKYFHTIPDSDEQSAEKRSLEEERIALNKERESLEAEKKLLDSQKKNIEIENKHLNTAKDLLQLEKISLEEEKSSLDQRSQLYETHYKNTLETEKNKFELKYSQIITEFNILHDCVYRKEERIEQLEAELAQYIKDMKLLDIQLKLYETDFSHEKHAKEVILEEKNVLNEHLQNQIQFNKLLLTELNRAHVTLSVPPMLSTPTVCCPICQAAFNDTDKLETHVNLCLGSE